MLCLLEQSRRATADYGKKSVKFRFRSDSHLIIYFNNCKTQTVNFSPASLNTGGEVTSASRLMSTSKWESEEDLEFQSQILNFRPIRKTMYSEGLRVNLG